MLTSILNQNKPKFVLATYRLKIEPKTRLMSNLCINSLIRIFLNIECLQVNLANFLLEKFAILSHEDFHKDDPKAGLHRKILNSLRWLNLIVDGEQLTNKLMELLDGASDDVLIEIVVS